MSHLEELAGDPAGRRLCWLPLRSPERNDGVRLAFCWSHVRRGFYELATPGPSPSNPPVKAAVAIS